MTRRPRRDYNPALKAKVARLHHPGCPDHVRLIAERAEDDPRYHHHMELAERFS